jgi:glycine cleavage system H protein
MAEVAPKNGEFLEGKLWFHRKGSIVTLGLTSVAVEEIGSVESIEFPGEGDDFDKGDIVVTIDGAQGKLEVITPAAGVVQEINEAAQSEPDMVSEDPLEEGWLIKLEIQDSTDLKEYGASEE